MLNSNGFDLWADGYDKSVGLSEESNQYPFAGYKDVLNTIYNEIRKRPQGKVLDIGFGTGTLTSRLYEDGFTITGIDFSKKMIAIAQPKMPQAQLIQHDFAQGISSVLDNQTFDFIITTYAFHHITDENKAAFVQECIAHLAPNGKMLIGDISFQTRQGLLKCQADLGGWDDDEFYTAFDELQSALPDFSLHFTPISFCAGIIEVRF